VDVDIHKPDTGAMHINRPSHQGSSRDSPEDASAVDSPKRHTMLDYTEPLSEGEEDEEMFPVEDDEDKRAGLTPEQAVAIINMRKQEIKDQEFERAKNPSALGSEIPQKPLRTFSVKSDNRPRVFTIDPLAPSAAFDEQLRSKLKDMKNRVEEQAIDDDESEPEHAAPNGREGGEPNHAPPDADGRILLRDWQAEPGKRIAVPVRIEPKVYFASERTFLVSFLDKCETAV
jgi:hypothetical protein